MDTKKLVVFDLDGTLAESKCQITDEIADLIKKLLRNYSVCIISGGGFKQFENQVLSKLKSQFISNLHLMPTCGTNYYKFSNRKNKFVRIYSEQMTEDQLQFAWHVANKVTEEMKLTKGSWGPIIENRDHSQVTISALGQHAPIEAKEKWDVTGDKKREMKNFVEQFFVRNGFEDELEVRIGGTTSVDITKYGLDKSFGIDRLLDVLNLKIKDTIFFGDKLEKDGNDYPIKKMGIDSIEVKNWEDTIVKVNDFLERMSLLNSISEN